MKSEKTANLLKCRWHITLFRFFAHTGNGRRAREHLDRVPLPQPTVDEATFQVMEKQTWGKYAGIDGEFRLLTPKDILTAAAKILCAGAALFFLLSMLLRLTGEIDQLKTRLATVSLSHVQRGAVPRFQRKHGPPLAIDTGAPPLRTADGLFFPVPFYTGRKTGGPGKNKSTGKEYQLFYANAGAFRGENLYLEDCRIARELVTRNGSRAYYVYSPGRGTGGRWLDREAFLQLEQSAAAALPPQEERAIIVPKDLPARQLRGAPGREAQVLHTLPPGTEVEFLRYAPVNIFSGGTLWIEVKHTPGEGNCARGWLPAFSVDRPYLKIPPRGNTLEVLAGALTFRESPLTGANAVPEVGKLTLGEQVEFIRFAPIHQLQSSAALLLQVRFLSFDSGGGRPSSHDGWISAGRIDKRGFRRVRLPAGENREDPGTPAHQHPRNQWSKDS